MMVSNREGTSLNRVNVKSWEANPYGKAKLCPYWPAGCAGLLPLPCIDVWHLAQQELKNFPKPKKNVYIYILGSVHPFLWVFWGWRWNFQPKTLELQERHPRNMMDKFSLIGLGCFKIFKGSTLWMRSRGLTLRPLFEWVVNSTTSKNGDFGCSLAGFKYPVPTCYTPTSSPLPLDSSQQKRTWKNESKNHPQEISREQIHHKFHHHFFPIWLSTAPNTPTKTPSPGWEAWRENAINFPICPTELSILIVGSGCGSEAKRLQPKRFHLGVQNVRRYAKSLSGVVFFLCTRNHPSKG